MAPLSSCAIGTAATEQYERRYSPRKPCELARILWPVAASNDPPSEFLMRGLASGAAFSARRGEVMRSFPRRGKTAVGGKIRLPERGSSCGGAGNSSNVY